MERKKIRLHSEVMYVFAILLMSFSVAMTIAADLGVSMIVAPAEIIARISDKDILTSGIADWVVEGFLFILLCIILRKFKPVYLASFITALIYGRVLDLFMKYIPFLDPSAERSMALRIVFLIVGMTLTSLAVASFFKCYIYSQIYDFFVKAVTDKFGIPLGRFKTGYDLCFLGVSIILSLIITKIRDGESSLLAIGYGTAVMTVCNGTIIALFSRFIDKHFVITPIFRKFSHLFDM